MRRCSYTCLGGFYAIHRVSSLFGKKACLAVIAVLGLAFSAFPDQGQYAPIAIFGIVIAVLGYDIELYGKRIRLHKLYENIIATVKVHPQMTSLKDKFSKNLSTEIGTHRKLCVLIVLLFMCICMFGYYNTTI